MMAALGGPERTKAEFEYLFRESGSELEEIVPAASTFSIIVRRPPLVRRILARLA
jgi:hypothetical protein